MAPRHKVSCPRTRSLHAGNCRRFPNGLTESAAKSLERRFGVTVLLVAARPSGQNGHHGAGWWQPLPSEGMIRVRGATAV